MLSKTFNKIYDTDIGYSFFNSKIAILMNDGMSTRRDTMLAFAVAAQLCLQAEAPRPAARATQAVRFVGLLLQRTV